MNFKGLLEKKVSGKVAMGFGLLALLELSIVFTPLFYPLNFADFLHLFILDFYYFQ